MELPVFDAIRAPARFAMPAILALSVAGAIAFSHLAARPVSRPVLALLFMAGVIADGWIGHLPLQPLPDRWPASRAGGYAAVLELPLGDVYDDIAARYRATAHGRPVLNGNSGFEPIHYFTLKTALAEHDPAALDGLPAGAPVLVVVDRRNGAAPAWERFLIKGSRVSALGGDDRWSVFAASPPPAATVCSGEPVPIAAVTGSDGPAVLSALTDRNPRTWWSTMLSASEMR